MVDSRWTDGSLAGRFSGRAVLEDSICLDGGGGREDTSMEFMIIALGLGCLTQKSYLKFAMLFQSPRGAN